MSAASTAADPQPAVVTTADVDTPTDYVIPRTDANGRVIGHDVVMPGGELLPYRKAPRKRPAKTGEASDISLDAPARAYALLRIKESYAHLTTIRLGTDPIKGGGPNRFPRQLWSLLFMLQNALATQTSLLQFVQLPDNLKVIVENIKSLQAELPLREQQAITRWLTSPQSKIPSRTYFGRFMSSLESRGWNFEEELAKQGAHIARELDRYDPTLPASDLTNAIIGDGTVFPAAAKSTDEFTADEERTITRRRVDKMALSHTEGTGTTLHGVKGAAIWSPSEERHGTVCLGFSWVPSPSPSIEAKVAIALTKSAHANITALGGLPSNFAYDKAAGRKDQETLNSLGMYLTTRAIGDQLDPDSDSHHLKPKPIGSYKPADGCKHTYQLVAISKQLHLHLINDTGEDTYIPLKHVHRSVTSKGKRYNYTDHEVDCQTRAGHKHTVTIPWNGWKSFNHKSKNSIQPVDRQRYDHILRYLQPHAPGTEDFKQAYGMRERTETMHSIIDALLYFTILQRWGKAAKSAFIFGYLMGHNILARAAQDGELRAIIRPDA